MDTPCKTKLFLLSSTKHFIDFQPINTKNKLKLRSRPWSSVRKFASTVKRTDFLSLKYVFLHIWQLFVRLCTSARQICYRNRNCYIDLDWPSNTIGRSASSVSVSRRGRVVPPGTGGPRPAGQTFSVTTLGRSSVNARTV